MSKSLTENELLRRLRREVDDAGSQIAWAERHGVNQGQVSQILRGTKPIGAWFASRMGYELAFKPRAGVRAPKGRRRNTSG